MARYIFVVQYSERHGLHDLDDAENPSSSYVDSGLVAGVAVSVDQATDAEKDLAIVNLEVPSIVPLSVAPAKEDEAG